MKHLLVTLITGLTGTVTTFAQTNAERFPAKIFKKYLFMPALLAMTLDCSACGGEDVSASTMPSVANPVPEPDPDPQPGKVRCLVVCFSCTNTTKSIADQIADITNGTCHRIMPETAYTPADLDYNNPSSRASREQNDVSARPAIRGKIEDLSGYDIIFIGYPIWWGKAPKIISTFLESSDFSGKILVPFCTSHSSGIGTSDADLHKLASQALWKAGKRFKGNETKQDIINWIESVIGAGT